MEQMCEICINDDDDYLYHLNNVLFTCKTKPIWEGYCYSELSVTSESNGFAVYEDMPFKRGFSVKNLVGFFRSKDDAIVYAYERGKKELEEWKAGKDKDK